ncbi:MAG TPA: mercuric transporter MerT family protein [Burkholderiales bacterium]|jgi:mercuric ion transport protein|nr:mercuric transporter MerT family protein [Burkholderiales bacterium]
MIKGNAETSSLVTGGIAAVFASACCVGPLVLVATGLGGAWLGYLSVFEPYRWIFIGIAVSALAFAGWKIYRPVEECRPGDACAAPRSRTVLKASFWFVAVFVAIAATLPYMADLLLGG